MTHLSQALRRFDLSNPHEVAKTAIATVWKVVQSDGSPAALKIFHDLDEKDEAPGFEVLKLWEGGPAARLFGRAPGMAVMEWLEGPSLGDLSRDERDAEANEHLIKVAQTAHQIPVHSLDVFETLEARFQTLFELRFAVDCPNTVRASVTECKALAKDLLSSSPTPQLLHGDLHHDNVLKGPRGWCAIDPKGVVGDPAYELANAFRNPLGQDALIRDPARTHALAKGWAQACGATPKRVLGWAACHTAVSMAWSLDTPLGAFPDSDLPEFYLSQMARAEEH